MKIPQIKSTIDYSIFTPNPLQRVFTENKVKIIKQKMRANGFPPSMAISVYLKGGKLIVNTGHHRLAAAKELSIPVLYIIENQWTPKQLVDEGVTTKPWDMLSAAQTFASEGNDDYKNLIYYADKGIPISMAASMLHGEAAASGNAKELVMNGTFQVNETTKINHFISMFEEFSVTNPAIKSRSFIAAVSKCFYVTEFDLVTLRRRLKENPKMLEKTSSTDQMLKLIEDIYNFRSVRKIPLAFMATDVAATRKVGFGLTK